MVSRLFLLMNSICNIRCSYCYYETHYDQRDRHRVYTDRASTIVSKVWDIGIRVLILTGGDPLHVKTKHETFAVIEAAKHAGLKVIINTSATMLKDDDLDQLVALDMDRIDISIDSHLEEVHNAQRERHSDTVGAIRALLNRGFTRLSTMSVVTELSAPTLEGTVRWLNEQGISDIHLHRGFIPRQEGQNDIITNGMKRAGKLLPHAHTPEFMTLTEVAFLGHRPPPHARCRMGKDYLISDAQGNISPCFHRSDLKLGNLFTDSKEALLENISTHQLVNTKVPNCFGKHCVALFDNPSFWETKES